MSKTPETQAIVINTGPLLALVAAWGDLNRLRELYRQIWVPLEVREEILQGGKTSFAVAEFEAANFLFKQTEALDISPFLQNTLDKGEAAVIQLALNQGIGTVCIDEAAGRRIARLNSLRLTGSIGILLRAKREGHVFSMSEAIARMQMHGIWLSKQVIQFALDNAEADDVKKKPL
jgi:predicted nucleic acid-binding protein